MPHLPPDIPPEHRNRNVYFYRGWENHSLGYSYDERASVDYNWGWKQREKMIRELNGTASDNECECACLCGAPVAIRRSGKHWDGEGVVDLHVNGQQVTVKWEWLRAAVEMMRP